MSHSYALLNNIFLRESTVIFNDPKKAAEGGQLNLSISAENISRDNEIFCLDFLFKVQAENEGSVLFEVSCKFEASIKVEKTISVESKEEQEKLASVAFLQVYPSIREYVVDTLRRMNLLLPISTIPFAIDFSDCDVKVNS
jgi:hypothetical protein